MTITRREFLLTLFTFTAGLLIGAVKPEREVRKVPVAVPLGRSGVTW